MLCVTCVLFLISAMVKRAPKSPCKCTRIVTLLEGHSKRDVAIKEDNHDSRVERIYTKFKKTGNVLSFIVVAKGCLAEEMTKSLNAFALLTDLFLQMSFKENGMSSPVSLLAPLLFDED